MPSNQNQTIDQAKRTYYPLGKAFEKQKEDQGQKEVDALKDLKSEGQAKSSEGIFPKRSWKWWN